MGMYLVSSFYKEMTENEKKEIYSIIIGNLMKYFDSLYF